MPERRKVGRRKGFVIEEAKFDTQKIVTYVILFFFGSVALNVLLHEDQAERSTVLQTVINFSMIAVGYWLGASKPTNGTHTAPTAAVAQTAAVAAVAQVAEAQEPKDK